MDRTKNNFTLIELILAGLLSMIIMTTMVTIWYGLVRLNDQVDDRVDLNYVKQYIHEVFSRDIRGVVKPTGKFAGPFSCRSGDEDQSYDLEFVSTNNSAYSEFGSDFCKVKYYVVDPAEDESFDDDESLDGTLVFVRSYTDNMNAAELDETTIQKTLLLRNIESVSYEFYDGSDEWLTEWESTTRDNALPLAIKLIINQYTTEDQDEESITTFEIVKQISTATEKK